MLCFCFIVAAIKISVVHNDKTPMVHAKSHGANKLDARHVLQQLDGGLLALNESMALNDEQPLANDKHMATNGMM